MASALDPQGEKLRHIQSIPALVKYLDEELGWPVHVDDWEDAVYDWQPGELNLKAEHEISVRSIKQLRPLISDQPWGIFFVDFEKGKLPVTVLRRMLNGLAIKSRAKDGSHQTWHANDLLFVSSFGSEGAREIALAHFTDESTLGDLPTLRVLGWDEADTPLELGHVARTLQEKLRWPANTSSKAERDAWRAQWSGAFSLKYRQVINDSKTLALALAELAKRIRSRVNAVLALESESGHLRQLHKAFKDNLISDLSADGFADMYAQTITYGLFAARASRGSGGLVADDAAFMAPSTNPFLRDLLQDFLHAGGRARRQDKRVDFDELGINEVVTTLREVPMDDVLRSFNASKPGDDPVIHFYEDFLKAYDKKLRAKRGVFYTPRPVVQFIVRSVDEILRTEFDIEDGLASTITWGEMRQRRPELAMPAHCSDTTPFVQILDPATGTATFIVEVIEHIHAHMRGKWNAEGLLTRAQWLPRWNDYVRLHLLPRLYAFELMMAPYAIAHMKIGIKLAETGYSFPDGGPRVNIFLTNALEPAHPVQSQLEIMAPMLAHEASAANRVKERLAATVVLGNPPYSLRSGNMTFDQRALVDRFRHVAGQEIKEKGALQYEKNLNDDYVKFFGLGDQFLGRTNCGVLCYITNHSYLDNPTLRGLRYRLLASAQLSYIVNLHGNTTKREVAPTDVIDQNVFEIKQGVAIGLFARCSPRSATVSQVDLWGPSDSKEQWLAESSLSATSWNLLSPSHEQYFLIPLERTLKNEYDHGFPLPSIMSVYGAGYITARDNLVVDFGRATLKKRIDSFKNSSLEDEELLKQYQVAAKPGWDLPAAREALRRMVVPSRLHKTYYRPFDWRWIFFDSSLVWGRSWPTHSHMAELPGNKAIVATRQTKDNWDVAAVNAFASHKCVSAYDTGTVFPLWLDFGRAKRPNLSPSFTGLLCGALGLTSADYRPSDASSTLHAENIFCFIYAVLHSPSYRNRYSAFLRTDFPRVPIPASREVFDALSALGEQLIAWQLLERPAVTAVTLASATDPIWFGGRRDMTKVAEKGKSLAENCNGTGKVFVNATSGFAGVKTSVWQHTIGGYQVLHKWLDDRRKAGHSLSDDDIAHWLRVYAALEATQGLMQQVDASIETHGGWPGAFSQNHSPPDAAMLAAEQQVQKEQLKARKTAVKTSDKNTMPASPTGATSLFDDLEDMAAAAGDPNRPKAKATPAAKAAGGKAVQARQQSSARATSTATAADINDVTEAQLMCAVRAVLVNGGPLPRADLLRQTARSLGFARVGPRINKKLDDAVRRAVRRGIAENNQGELSLVAKSIDGYDRAFLKLHLLGVVNGSWRDKADVRVRFARYLGFARVGQKLEETAWSLMRSLVRAGLVEVDGRGSDARYRRNKG